MSTAKMLRLNVGGANYATTLDILTYEENSLLADWFLSSPTAPPLPIDNTGAFFIDRDPLSFGVILNYLRLKAAGQLWEACLPKDPDRLALLTQEAEYFRLNALKDQALQLLQSCTQERDMDYFNQVMVESKSCPMGLAQAAKRDPDQYNREPLYIPSESFDDQDPL